MDIKRMFPFTDRKPLVRACCSNTCRCRHRRRRLRRNNNKRTKREENRRNIKSQFERSHRRIHALSEVDVTRVDDGAGARGGATS